MEAIENKWSCPGTLKIINVFDKTVITLFLLLSLLVVFTTKVEARDAKLGIKGYDLISYFQDGQARKGSSKHSVIHDGTIYYFSNKKHASIFKTNPEKYLPAYNGHCAFGMAFGNKSTVDPKVWRIVDGQLYLWINPGTQKAWSKSQNEYIRRGQLAWQFLSQQSN